MMYRDLRGMRKQNGQDCSSLMYLNCIYTQDMKKETTVDNAQHLTGCD